MRDRILYYMAQGLTASQTASIVGCTASYINQLGKEELFLSQLTQARSETQAKDVDEDKVLTNKYMALEHKILGAIETAMPMAELPALVRALEVVGSRQEKRALRLATPIGQVPNGTVIVNITLPSHAVPEYQVNSQREVIAIDNKTVAPMSSDGVANLFKQKLVLRQEQAKQSTTVTELTEF
jgi:hypothetical protein